MFSTENNLNNLNNLKCWKGALCKKLELRNDFKVSHLCYVNLVSTFNRITAVLFNQN